MRVLVTGGAGYLGTSLIMELSKNPDVLEIIVYDNLSRGSYNFFLNPGSFENKIRFVEADILDSRTFQTAIQGVDLVYHLAAKATTPFADRDAQLYEQVNHWGTAETVGAIEKSDVRRFVFISSASVYGTSTEEMHELSTPNPKSIYGISKLKAEKQIERLHDCGIPSYIIRCGNIFGFNPSMRFDGVINRFAFDANFRRRITINGNGEQFRSFISVERSASILANLISSDLPPSCYNLVDQSQTINEVADIMSDVFEGLERIYINQDLQLNQLRVKPNSELNALSKVALVELPEYLQEFRNHFSFS